MRSGLCLRSPAQRMWFAPTSRSSLHKLEASSSRATPRPRGARPPHMTPDYDPVSPLAHDRALRSTMAETLPPHVDRALHHVPTTQHSAMRRSWRSRRVCPCVGEVMDPLRSVGPARKDGVLRSGRATLCCSWRRPPSAPWFAWRSAAGERQGAPTSPAICHGSLFPGAGPSMVPSGAIIRWCAAWTRSVSTGPFAAPACLGPLLRGPCCSAVTSMPRCASACAVRRRTSRRMPGLSGTRRH